jgi:hypothetical protein
MVGVVNQGYIEFPAEWKHLESNNVGPFITRIVHRKPDGRTDTRTSRSDIK